MSARSNPFPRYGVVMARSVTLQFAKPMLINWNGRTFLGEASRLLPAGKQYTFPTIKRRDKFAAMCNSVLAHSCVPLQSPTNGAFNV